MCLQAFPDMAAFTSVAVQVLRIWCRSMIDDGRRNALKHFTLVGAFCMHLNHSAFYYGLHACGTSTLAEQPAKKLSGLASAPASILLYLE